MVDITLPLVNGLPEGCEPPTLKSSKYHTSRTPVIYYKHHSKNSVPRQSPDFIFLDFVPCWVPEIAAKFGIGSAFFSAVTAATLAYLGPPAEMKSLSRQTREEDLTPKRNAKLLLEKGVGYEVPRKEDGSFNPDAVAES
ncbi:UDP-glycosyltransferase 91C1-like [Actinidia eriantha]|uniref:UDP-glycosyltransferase 91C1-like n=1 Tax=Actinidia eriantha TaxID=165200 RepID=UPI0025884525|nr:UDP-glycosyltransferase 91C1-like [Actinidia eriantha]